MTTTVPEPAVYSIAGPRKVDDDTAKAVTFVTIKILSAGHFLAVGCCTGVDAAAIRAGVMGGHAWSLDVMTAFGPLQYTQGMISAEGTGSSSSLQAVSAAKFTGAAVTPWAGGPAREPLATRLARRTAAVVERGRNGAILVTNGDIGPGSARFMAEAIRINRALWVVIVSPRGAFTLPLANWRTWRPVRDGEAFSMSGYEVRYLPPAPSIFSPSHRLAHPVL